MKVWSRGLGKQALNVDWFKTDLKLEGNKLIVKGIAREKGIIWDCQFTFSKDDVPGILHMLLSFALVRLVAMNILRVFPAAYNRFILRRAGKEKSKGSS